MVSVRVAASLLLFLLLLAPSAADAQSPMEEARVLFDRGIEHAAHEEWVQALSAFRASAERYDRPSTRLNIGSVLLRLGRHLEARDEMRTLLARSDLDADARAQAEALLTRTATGIRRVEVAIDPPNAELVVDGAVVEGSGRTRQVELDPGAHRLEARAEGHVAEVRSLTPEATALSLRLSPRPARLRVRANIEEARISVDGEDSGRGSVELELAAGRHELVVTALSHEPFERWLSLTSGQQLDVMATLAPNAPAEDEVWQSPWFWVIGGAGLAVAAVAIALGVVFSQSSYDGGTVNDVLVPQ